MRLVCQRAMTLVYFIVTSGLLTVADAAYAAVAAKQEKRPASEAQLNERQAYAALLEEIDRLRDWDATPVPAATVQQKAATLTLRAARHAERLLAAGDEAGFNRYIHLIRSRLGQTELGLKTLAARNIGGAEFALGVLALHGVFAERDLARACSHFIEALHKGFGAAKFRYAQCAEAIDPELAYQLLKEAAGEGHAAAQERLGRVCLEAQPPDAGCARQQFERAARAGRASATALLGWMASEGIGAAADPRKAQKLYRDAAQRGDASAANNLGEIFERGRDVPQDPQEALRWYRRGAEAGHALAQYNAGRLLLGGRAAPTHAEEATRWLRLAANSGVREAQELLEALSTPAEAVAESR